MTEPKQTNWVIDPQNLEDSWIRWTDVTILGNANISNFK